MPGSGSTVDQTLGRISVHMTSTLALGEVLAAITHGLVEELDVALARIWLLGAGDPRQLELVASAGLSDRLDGSHARVEVGALKIGVIVADRTALCLNGLAKDTRISDPRWVAEHGLVAFAGYPLEFRGELLGVLAVFAKRELTDGEFARLGMFAAQASVAIANARLFEQVSQLSRRLEAENAYLKEELQGERPASIVGTSASLQRVVRELEHVAPTSSTVLLLGETGTGKELFARALHEASPRRGKPLVKVNCAAIAPTLFESELFGHEKGAFTGALQRRLGRFELATGGTLFLDEVGELPLEAQAKLLRVLQEQELERVGGTESITVDVRVVAATNRDLAADVRAKRFRADLFYRLSVFPIQIPALRERREDLPALVDTIVLALRRRLGFAVHGVEPDALAYLQAYDWPGNVRELQNVIERAAILARGKPIRVADLPELRTAFDSEPTAPPSTATGETQSLKDQVDAYERKLLVDAMARAGGNQSEAARLLQTSRATLQYKLKAHQL
jgi:Nif-specific regulatory protein